MSNVDLLHYKSLYDLLCSFFDTAKIRKILPKKLEKLCIFFLPLQSRVEIFFLTPMRGRCSSFVEARNKLIYKLK